MMQLTEGSLVRCYEAPLSSGIRMGNECGSWHALSAETKECLESGSFSYPRLAASYRYGYDALRKQKFMVSRLKTPINRIYRRAFCR